MSKEQQNQEPQNQESHRNDEIILYKLDEMSHKIDAQTKKIDEYVSKTDYIIFGNGTPGLKTMVEVLKTRVTIISLFVLGAWSAIVGSFFNGS